MAKKGAKSNKRKAIGKTSAIILVNQVDGLCPLCSKPLIDTKKGVNYPRYDVAHIYPLNPSEAEIELLKHEERLSDDPNHLDNLIPVCPGCHRKFDHPRTVEEYRDLLEIKKVLISKEKLRNSLSLYQLEEDLKNIILNLKTTYPYDELAELKLDPKELNNKVNDTMSSLTKRRIELNITDYFYFVKDQLARLEAEKPGKGKLILSQVKTFYLKQEVNEATQQTIYENVREWISRTTNSSNPEAADILTSFFVQNCEVFE
ncbi:MAG: HNH endonuclease [Blastopirellula sp.]|nr:MAG: HNH endonuclease [Blastopirellula sp.]